MTGRMKVPPFPCPNCGHEILIDALHLNEEGVGEVRVIDHTATHEARQAGEPWPGLYARDRKDLAQENMGLRRELFALRTRKWWQRLGRKG